MTTDLRARTSIMVTRGDGYIGSHTVLALLEAGYPVVVLDDLSTGCRADVARDARFVECDVADGAMVVSILAKHGIEADIHFAGSIRVEESVSDPLKYYRNNICASRTLIETCARAGVGEFIFSSTAATYGNPESMPIREDAAIRPTIRIFGADYPTPNGTCIRNYVHVTDLADAHVRVLEWLPGAGEVEVFNCGYGHGYSVRKVLNMVERVWGRSLNAEQASHRAGYADAPVSDNARPRQRTGWQPRHDDLETIVRTALGWERKIAGEIS